MDKNIGWGIIGLGNIAQKFADCLKLVSDAELIGVASRNEEKAVDFGIKNDSKYSFGSYEELFNCEEVQVIYIATPHTAHTTWAIKAMKAGKSVLCEKPMGVNRGQVEQMINEARKNNVFLMEALWSRFNPAIAEVKKKIDAGDIGEVGYLHADFAFYALDRPEEGRLLNPELAGGSLLDIGIYPIFLAYLILENPEKIKSAAKFHKTGVEIQISLLFEYQRAMALLYSGLNSSSEMKAQISGTKGSIYLNPRWHETQGYTLEKNGKQEVFSLPLLGKGYEYEIMEVNACLKEEKKESELWSLKNSLDLIVIMDEIRRQCSIKFPFES
ncbi:MAG: Gfo/Idh/MocA family oxidoreductase [Eudoraea sp.]